MLNFVQLQKNLNFSSAVVENLKFCGLFGPIKFCTGQKNYNFFSFCKFSEKSKIFLCLDPAKFFVTLFNSINARVPNNVC